jgi:hypothetical protein
LRAPLFDEENSTMTKRPPADGFPLTAKDKAPLDPTEVPSMNAPPITTRQSRYFSGRRVERIRVVRKAPAVHPAVLEHAPRRTRVERVPPPEPIKDMHDEKAAALTAAFKKQTKTTKRMQRKRR